MKKASIISVGAYVPKDILTNFDLEKMVETSDEWIVKRTGIKTRHLAKNEITSDLAYKAALVAIQRSGIDKNDIDAVICATITPDYFCMPSTACKVASNLGLFDVTAFDISAACTGFIYLLEIAKSLVESGAKKNVLIIGAEKLSSIINWEDRSTCVLFGDGAGAAIVSSLDDNYIIDVHTSSDGSKGNLLITPGCGIVHPANKDTIDKKLNFLHMSGNEVFKIAVNTLTKDVVDILEKNSIDSKDIDLFIPHQANLRIIEAVKQRLDFTDEQCVITVVDYGNTSSASIPMAMNDAYEAGRLKQGSLILLDAFGGGFTWGSALLRFGGK
ncbi:beta-ketoacyl-ACP synthase III [Campylobacter fetus]|uniref:beta-ketoacyl-ACP synthase III n=1 Tax=Campylobacter fetus TaxID=196 RepID=UPI0003C2A4FA|nr:beta-ketoacyl-ACP synthase III [Campylobacter fetus]AGZ81132.1 beta-ketoacyl-[acp] synthase III (KASIII) [Campylobacter fetus subsp. testudinum 03-427]ALV64226.1 beta-ketoacyl-[acp] synthase III (KASIII) [Campylobacter fetus subsp. testudinum Sp3]AVK80510.1 ketoacyl-ACP synthase III [Campylobacter fetus subsp. testudinum]EAI4321532.1 ketoacyl-ACP synthase III [Campylobacter fetus]EAI4391386.1 ketoacyl-ACP synthase III [Campylobacter fetus]